MRLRSPSRGQWNTQLFTECSLSCCLHLIILSALRFPVQFRGVRFRLKVGQICSKWDTPGNFFRSDFSRHTFWLSSDLKKSRISPIWGLSVRICDKCCHGCPRPPGHWDGITHLISFFSWHRGDTGMTEGGGETKYWGISPKIRGLTISGTQSDIKEFYTLPLSKCLKMSRYCS